MMTRDPWKLAVSLFRSGDMRGALEKFEEIAAADGKDAYLEIGNIYEQDWPGRDIDQAIKWYRQSVEYADEPKAHVALARILMNSDHGRTDFRQAQYHLKKAIELDPSEAGAWFGLGLLADEALGRPGNIDEAADYYNMAVENGHLYARNRLARIDLKRGHYLKGFVGWVGAGWKIFRDLRRHGGSKVIRLQ